MAAPSGCADTTRELILTESDSQPVAAAAEVPDHGREPEVIEVTEADLPVACPTPAMGLWNRHPRVYLPLREKGEASCPYCGTRFRLVAAA